MIYACILILLFLAELAYFKLADQFNIVDKPNERSSHKQVTLLGGGVIFYLAMLGYFLISGFQYPWFFSGLTLIAVISFIDDIRPQSYKIRLIVQLISILLMFYQSGLFKLPWYFILIALVLSVGILNAYNFMDGINGMIGIYTTVVMVSLWYINRFVFAFVDEQIIYYLLLALVVFNFFNFRTKARCFSGDVGALSLAFVVVFLLGMLIVKSENITWIGLLAVFGVDTILTIIHRLILKENIFIAHRKHLFQLLVNELNYSHLIVSTLYSVIQISVVGGLLFFEDNAWLYLLSVISSLSIIYYCLKRKYFHLHQSSVKPH
ncbi:MAG: glycosyltransferase family 4 protein [Paludibacter sp.]|nr:glycosyltransferase family 4 protein [Paludibacter sp.]MDD4427947.1 glycosyltransferase family 4 protein [Paludibacter sp.]